MISTDRKIFDSASEVKARMKNYATALDELFIIILGEKHGLIIEGRLKYLGLTHWQAWWYRPKTDFDLVTSQDPFENGLIARRLAKKLKAKLELQIHTDFLSPYFVKHSILNRLRVLIASQTLPQADYIRVVSQRIKQSLKAKSWKLKAIIEVRPVEVDLEKIKQTPITVDLHQKYPQFKKIILMASRLEPEKQIDLAIKNLIKLLISDNIGLIIVGAGSEEGRLKSLTEELGLSNYVKFDGWQENLATYYKTADLFLSTSLYEGYGLTLVEAKSCGLPIVSTDVGVAREAGATITTIDTLTPIIKHLLAD